MTVSSLIPVNTYTGNNSSTKFDFDFLIESEEELKVSHINQYGIQRELKNGKDYSISSIGNKNGGYILFPLETSKYKILGDNEKIILELTLPIKQESKFENSGSMSWEAVEWSFDNIVRILQIMSRKIAKAVKIPESNNETGDNILDALEKAQANSQDFADLAAKKAEDAINAAKDAIKQAEDAKTVTDKVKDALDIIKPAQENSLGMIKPDNKTTQVDKEGIISSNELGYKPFSINSGTTRNGYNATLHLLGSKIREIDFITPRLTKNGVTGGNEFAVETNGERSGDEAWHALDGSESTLWHATQKPADFIFYNPEPLKVTKLEWLYIIAYPYGGYNPSQLIVYGSDNKMTWEFLTDTFTDDGKITVDLSNNAKFYHYYKIHLIQNTASNTGENIRELTIYGKIQKNTNKNIICEPCVITDILGKKNKINVQDSYDVSKLDDGNYEIFRNIVTKKLEVFKNFVVSNKQPKNYIDVYLADKQLRDTWNVNSVQFDNNKLRVLMQGTLSAASGSINLDFKRLTAEITGLNKLKYNISEQDEETIYIDLSGDFSEETGDISVNSTKIAEIIDNDTLNKETRTELRGTNYKCILENAVISEGQIDLKLKFTVTGNNKDESFTFTAGTESLTIKLKEDKVEIIKVANANSLTISKNNLISDKLLMTINSALSSNSNITLTMTFSALDDKTNKETYTFDMLGTEIQLTFKSGFHSTIWADTSKYPNLLKKKETIDGDYSICNELVHIGKCQILNGSVNKLVNNFFNHNFVESPVIVESYQNGISGYRIWSNGYCEQWSRLLRTQTGITYIGFLVNLKQKKHEEDYDYVVGLTYEGADSYNSSENFYTPYITQKSFSGMNIVSPAPIAQMKYIDWKVSGYIDDYYYQIPPDDEDYIYEDFTNPIITDAGTIGGERFSVYWPDSGANGNYDWHLFDGNKGTSAQSTGRESTDIIVYNPKELKIETMIITHISDKRFCPTRWVISGSNDNELYTEIKVINSPDRVSADWQIVFDENENYYKYYKFHCENPGWGFCWNEFQIKGKERYINV